MKEPLKLQTDKRYLFRVPGTAELQEGSVNEFSPSALYVNIGWKWHRTDQVELVEELETSKAEAPSEPPGEPAPFKVIIVGDERHPGPQTVGGATLTTGPAGENQS